MMNRRRLGSKDIHLDANSLRVLWLADAGGSNFPQFVPVTRGFNDSTSAQIEGIAGSGGLEGPRLPDGADAYGMALMMTPSGYTGTLTVTPVIRHTAGVSGDIRMASTYQTWDNGPSFTLGTETTIALADANEEKALTDISINIAIDTDPTWIVLGMYRDGNDVLDTFGNYINAEGFIVSYG